MQRVKVFFAEGHGILAQANSGKQYAPSVEDQASTAGVVLKQAQGFVWKQYSDSFPQTSLQPQELMSPTTASAMLEPEKRILLLTGKNYTSWAF